MNKRIHFALSLAALLTLSACGGNPASEPQPSSESSSESTSSTSSAPSSTTSSTSTSTSEASSLPRDVPHYDEPSFQIHYLRKDNKYENWNLWLWSDNKDGARYDFNAIDDVNGAIAAYPLSALSITSEDNLNFIVRKSVTGNDWSAKDPDGDRAINLSLLTPDENEVYHIYLKTEDATVYITPDYKVLTSITSATFYSKTRLHVAGSVEIKEVTIYENGEPIYVHTPNKPAKSVNIDANADLQYHVGSEYKVKAVFNTDEVAERTVFKGQLYGSSEFEAEYAYDGHDLGVTVEEGKTSFKVWSPFSKSIEVRIYNSGTPESLDEHLGDDTIYATIPLTLGEKGVWSGEAEEVLYDKYYTLFVVSSAYPRGIEIVDPYAKGAGINGLRGLIVDFSKTNPDNWGSIAPQPYDRKALTVYESHLQDLTASPTWNGPAEKAKKYEGFYQAGTTYEGVTTGFDHIKELGVNAVQIQPFFDHANDERSEYQTFNWGYNPLNYNVLEGSYSSDPYDGYARIREFKNLVAAYAEEGINIIMDVVYNHVNGAIGSNFDVLMPEYYFRYSMEKLTSASGCGNDTRSENIMMQRFIEDSVTFWAKEYKLGGFRFDLMGLHDIGTMNAVVEDLQNIDPSIVVFGEPWNMGNLTDNATPASQNNIGKWVGFGGFNDNIRDALIKGGLSGDHELAWSIDPKGKGNASAVINGIKGQTGVMNYDPNKAVTYASCHDNYTLYDRAYMAGAKQRKEADRFNDEELFRDMAMSANSIVFTSQGTAFMLSGEEMLRTKTIINEETGEPELDENGFQVKDKNSYKSPYEENAIDYGLKVAHPDLFENYKKLIALKQRTDGLHADETGAQAIEFSGNDHEIIYEIFDAANGKAYKIVHADGYANQEAVDFSGYSLYLDNQNNDELLLSEATPISPFQTIIGVADRV